MPESVRSNNLTQDIQGKRILIALRGFFPDANAFLNYIIRFNQQVH